VLIFDGRDGGGQGRHDQAVHRSTLKPRGARVSVAGEAEPEPRIAPASGTFLFFFFSSVLETQHRATCRGGRNRECSDRFLVQPGRASSGSHGLLHPRRKYMGSFMPAEAFFPEPGADAGRMRHPPDQVSGSRYPAPPSQRHPFSPAGRDDPCGAVKLSSPTDRVSSGQVGMPTTRPGGPCFFYKPIRPNVRRWGGDQEPS